MSMLNVYTAARLADDDPERALWLLRGALGHPATMLAPLAAIAPPSPAIASSVSADRKPLDRENPMNRHNALAAANVSDADALAAARALDMPPSQRPKLWRERWENSAALQREFADPETYSSYMEGCARGRIQRCNLPV